MLLTSLLSLVEPFPNFVAHLVAFLGCLLQFGHVSGPLPDALELILFFSFPFALTLLAQLLRSVGIGLLNVVSVDDDNLVYHLGIFVFMPAPLSSTITSYTF